MLLFFIPFINLDHMDSISEESGNQFSLPIYLSWEWDEEVPILLLLSQMRICIPAFCHVRNIKKRSPSLSSMLHLLQN